MFFGMKVIATPTEKMILSPNHDVRHHPSLLVEDTHAADSYTRHLCYKMSTMRSCRIQHPHFSDVDAETLARSIMIANKEEGSSYYHHPSSLQRLAICNCPALTSKGVTALIRAIVLSNTRVSHIELSSVPIGGEGLKAMAECFLLLQSREDVMKDDSSEAEQASSTLVELDIQDIGGPIEESAWSSFLKCILPIDEDDEEQRMDNKKNCSTTGTGPTIERKPNLSGPKLKSLNLSRNGLTDKHMVELSKRLVPNRTLKSLVLSDNPIGDDGMKILCRQVLAKQTSGIRLFAVGSCSLTGASIDPILQCLRYTNTSLQHIYLYANAVENHDHSSDHNGNDDAGAANAQGSLKEVKYWLDMNLHGGRRYIVQNTGGGECFVRSKWIAPILARIPSNRSDLMYGILMEMPHSWIPPP